MKEEGRLTNLGYLIFIIFLKKEEAQFNPINSLFPFLEDLNWRSNDQLDLNSNLLTFGMRSACVLA